MCVIMCVWFAVCVPCVRCVRCVLCMCGVCCVCVVCVQCVCSVCAVYGLVVLVIHMGIIAAELWYSCLLLWWDLAETVAVLVL